jgi:transcriptional regulator with XRE-family HTH domain
MNIGQKLRNCRKKQNIKITDVAAFMNVRQNTVIDWEKGNTDIPLKRLFVYLSFLDITPSSFFSDVETPLPDDDVLKPKIRLLNEKTRNMTPDEIDLLINIADKITN